MKEQFAWRHFYWYLTNEGIQYLRDYLHLPPEIVPATLRRSRPETGRPRPKGQLGWAQGGWAGRTVPDLWGLGVKVGTEQGVLVGVCGFFTWCPLGGVGRAGTHRVMLSMGIGLPQGLGLLGEHLLRLGCDGGTVQGWVSLLWPGWVSHPAFSRNTEYAAGTGLVKG